MRLWQHLFIGSFIAYILCAGVIGIGQVLQRVDPASSAICMLLLILLPFVLGPAAALALIADIRARWVDPSKRKEWLWLCLLLWPVGIYYYFVHGFRKLPARAALPALPQGYSAPPPIPGMPPQLPVLASKSSAAANSLIWGAVAIASPFVPLLIPAAFVGIFLGHKGLGEIRRSKGRFTNRHAAVGGLCLSYSAVVFTGLALLMWGSIISSIQEFEARNSPENLVGVPGYEAAREAERRMDTSIINGGVGNSTKARLLAAELSKGIVRVQKLNFAPMSPLSKTRVDTAPFIFCHLEEDSCVVLLRLAIPVTLSQKDQGELYSVLWSELHDVIARREILKDGDRVAMAVRGYKAYQFIYVGEFHGAPADAEEIPVHENLEALNSLETLELFYRYFAAREQLQKKSANAESSGL